MKPAWLMLVAALALHDDCDGKRRKRTPPPVDPARAAAEAALTGKKWIGMFGSRAVEMSFVSSYGDLKGEARFYEFDQQTAVDRLKATWVSGGSFVIAGDESYNTVIGNKVLNPDPLTATLSSDGKTLSGEADEPATWALTMTQNVHDLVPPIEAAAGENALVNGRWEGKSDHRPAKLVVSANGARLVGKLTRGNDTVNVEATVDTHGLVKLAIPTRPSARGLVTEDATLRFTDRELTSLRGVYRVTTKSGFVTSSGSDELWLIDLGHRARK